VLYFLPAPLRFADFLTVDFFFAAFVDDFLAGFFELFLVTTFFSAAAFLAGDSLLAAAFRLGLPMSNTDCICVGPTALFIWLYRRCPRILGAVTIVRPETAVPWHRMGFAACWRWKSRPRSGRPRIGKEVRDLIRRITPMVYAPAAICPSPTAQRLKE
jgi:hypothetical protein